MSDDRALMGAVANRRLTRVIAWVLFIVITAANLWLVVETFSAI